MEVKNNISLNSIDKAYNVFTTEKNINKEKDNDKVILERPVNSDINFNLNKIDNNKSEVNDISSLLNSIKSSIENGANADIFSSSRPSNISDLLK